MSHEPEAGDRFTFHDYFTRRRTGLRRFPELVRIAFGVVWSAAPRELVVSALLQITIGIALAIQLLVVRALLGDLLGGDGRPAFSALVPELVALGALGALVAVASSFLDATQRVLGELVSAHAADEVISTASEVDLITYDLPGFHDRVQRAQLSAGTRPTQMVSGLLGAGAAIFAILGIGVALVMVEPLFCALLVVAFAPAWVATNRAARLIHGYSLEQTERERRRLYLLTLLTGKEAAQEIRAFDLGRFLGNLHRRLSDRLIADLRTILRRRLRIALVGQVLTAALSTGVVAVLVWFVTSGRMSLADAGTAAAGLILLITRLRGLSGSAAGLYEGSLYLEDYTSFVAARPRIQADRPTQAAPADPQIVAAEAVTFTYPSRTGPSLIEGSLVLRRGEVVALVGENGSGKTTLAKLLAGLYRPGSGRVTWDGADTRDLDPATIAAQVAVIFQDFVRYQLSAHENVALGDHARFDDTARLERAARAAGIHDAIGELQQGYETLLGPEYYGGSDLSGGQWQRIGLARAFFRDAPFVILDEPTASLDPRAEAALYERMRELFAGRGVLLISHRFGSVRTADRIYVLQAGRVCESGTHGELMDRDGYYAELFRLQASSFLD